MNHDGVINGVHTYTPSGYKEPPTALLQQRLSDFCDKKLGLMLHFGPYTNAGLIESWALCDQDAAWSQKQIDWTNDIDHFKRQYYGLSRSFNPIRFDPARWAKTAKEAGAGYVLFTMKHHDGFCMYDTAYTDYKVTAPDCPFSVEENADIARALFERCRAEGLWVAAYFSKPDWHHEDYWENHGIGYQTTRYPSYHTKQDPERWARFVRFLHAQVHEIADRYTPDILWFDGGWIRRETDTDPRMEELIAAVREKHPGILAANRTVTGCCEDFITPEQQFPPAPLTIPWESCMTLTECFSYRFGEHYITLRALIHRLVKIVARGGNLAINVSPQPDGALPQGAVARLQGLGAWLRAAGEAIYSTRICAPYEAGNLFYTRAKKPGCIYAIALWKNAHAAPQSLTLPLASDKKVKAVHALCCSRAIAFEQRGASLTLSLTNFVQNPYADAFRIESEE